MIRIVQKIGSLVIVAVAIGVAHADPPASARLGDHVVVVKAVQDKEDPVIIARIDTRPLTFVTTADALNLKTPAKYWVETSTTIQNMTWKTIEAVRIDSISYDTFNTPVGKWTLEVQQESSNIPLLTPGAARTLAWRSLAIFDEVTVTQRIVAVRFSDQSLWQPASK